MVKNIEDEIAATLKSYIYLDEFEINALYNQLHVNILEQTSTYETQKSSNLDGEVNGTIAELLSVGGNLSCSKGKNIINEIKTIIPIERKTNIIIQHVCNNHLKPLENIIDTEKKNHSLFNGRIVAGHATFALTQIYDKEDRLIDLTLLSNNFDKRDATFILESGCRKNLEQFRVSEESDFYKKYSTSVDKYGIEMHMGGNKMRREVRHLTQLIKKGKAFEFGVLGQISYAGDIYYSIKPFAIW